MCGIVGYIGNQSAQSILITGLKNLEYRGYDSAGITLLNENKLVTYKCPGRVNNLSNLINFNSLKGNVGIAHTRWATHGKPSYENAHPHLDNSQSFSVVHNGIIENYNELKTFLLSKGYNFVSETDTEVIPNLIHYYYTLNNDFLTAVKYACNDLQGSYALSILSKYDADKIIVTKKDSPLVIGTKPNENFISSDFSAFLDFTNKVYFIQDLEFAEIYSNKINFYDNNLQNISKDVQTIELNSISSEKKGFSDYMLKEIHEQPFSILKTLEYSFKEIPLLQIDYINIEKIYIIACGTAMHAGLVGKRIIEELCNIPCEVDIASEFRYRNPILHKKSLSIFISQSGETADTLAALKHVKSHSLPTLAITNVIGSTITRIADFVLYTQAGLEVAVASTKAYTAQLAMLVSLAIEIATKTNSYTSKELETLKNDLFDIPNKINSILVNTSHIEKLSQQIYKESDIYYIGRGLDYFVCLEGSLKLKEISYIHSEACAAGELKHGPIALIENDTYVVSVITDSLLLPKTISNIQEVISRGAKTILITNQKIQNNVCDYIVDIPKTSYLLSPLLSVVPLQLLSYFVAKGKNLDVDKPRNLAKSVTVE